VAKVKKTFEMQINVPTSFELVVEFDDEDVDVDADYEIVSHNRKMSQPKVRLTECMEGWDYEHLYTKINEHMKESGSE